MAIHQRWGGNWRRPSLDLTSWPTPLQAYREAWEEMAGEGTSQQQLLFESTSAVVTSETIRELVMGEESSSP